MSVAGQEIARAIQVPSRKATLLRLWRRAQTAAMGYLFIAPALLLFLSLNLALQLLFLLKVPPLQPVKLLPLFLKLPLGVRALLQDFFLRSEEKFPPFLFRPGNYAFGRFAVPLRPPTVCFQPSNRPGCYPFPCDRQGG